MLNAIMRAFKQRLEEKVAENEQALTDKEKSL